MKHLMLCFDTLFGNAEILTSIRIRCVTGARQSLECGLQPFSIFLNAGESIGDTMLLRFEGFQLDVPNRSLLRLGEPVLLQPKTFDLLVYLASHAQRAVAREELIEALWPNSYVEESNLSQHIFLLRKALTGVRDGRDIIVTLPGRGYQFAAKVEAPPPLMPHTVPPATGSLVLRAVESITRVEVEEEEEEEVAPQPAALPPRRSRRWLAYTIAAAILLLAASGSWLAWRRFHRPPETHIDLVLAELENTTGDPELDHVLNQALLIDLEQSPFLNLLPRSRLRETLVEMQRRPEDALIPALALEVCERNNAQAMLHGSISKLGSRYLVILDADSCVSGKQIAGDRAEAASKEQVLGALDSVARRVRQELGESSASMERYRIPITQATTPSLDALRAYSEAGDSFWHGDMKAAQILFNRAIALDPNFASAYRALGSSYYNLGDYAQAAAYYKKAFEARDHATERERLGIEAMYYGYALNDYEEAIRRNRQSLEIYPNVTNSWVNLSNLYTKLGEHAQAVDAAEQAHRLDPHSSVATVELARSYLDTSRFADAKKIADQAVAEGKDHWDIHSILFRIAFAERDAARIKSEGEWGLTHQHADTSFYDLAFAAAAAGRLHEAVDDFTLARTEALRSGDQDFANEIELDAAEALAVMGEASLASTALRQVKETTGDPGDRGKIALLRVETGETATAQRFLSTAGSADNRNTVEAQIYVPLVRATLALNAHKPAEALRALEPARPYELRDFSVPYLRARAETEAGMFDAAAQDYRLILANQGVDPFAPAYYLSHLGLARLLAEKKQTAEARIEYQAFLDAWKNADSGLPILHQAKSELARLQ
jgi:eukaryotic-like serine/threonine-protein kinase